MTRRVLAVHTLMQVPSLTPRNLMIELHSHSKLLQNSLLMFPIHSAPIIPKYAQKKGGAMNKRFQKDRASYLTNQDDGTQCSCQLSPNITLRISALESQPLLFRSHYLKNAEVTTFLTLTCDKAGEQRVEIVREQDKQWASGLPPAVSPAPYLQCRMLCH